MKRKLFFLAVLIGVIIRIIVSWINRGYQHPDEFTNYLEIPFQWVYSHYKNHFDLGDSHIYRSHFILGWHWAVMKIFYLFRIESPYLVEGTLKTFMAFISFVSIYFSYLLMQVFEKKLAPWLVLFLLYWHYNVYFSVHILSENYSILFTTLALFYLAKAEKNSLPRKNIVFFSVLICIATQFRLQSAYFMIFPFFYYLKKNYRDALVLVLAFWLPMVFFGLAEFFYKGKAFATLMSYVSTNITDEGLILEYSKPFYEYIAQYNIQFTEWFFPFFIFFAIKGLYRYSPLLLGSVFFFFIGHQIFPNKVLRFISPITPLLIIGFMLGVYHFYQHSPKSLFFKKSLLGFLLLLLLTAQIFQVRKRDWYGTEPGATCRLVDKVRMNDDAKALILLGKGVHVGHFTLFKDLPIEAVTENDYALFLKTPQTDLKNVYIVYPKNQYVELSDWAKKNAAQLQILQEDYGMILGKLDHYRHE